MQNSGIFGVSHDVITSQNDFQMQEEMSIRNALPTQSTAVSFECFSSFNFYIITHLSIFLVSRHYMEFHVRSAYICRVCPFDFSTDKARKRHEDVMHAFDFDKQKPALQHDSSVPEVRLLNYRIHVNLYTFLFHVF